MSKTQFIDPPNLFGDIIRFHRKFDLEYTDGPRPQLPGAADARLAEITQMLRRLDEVVKLLQTPENLQVFRTRFMIEELTEYVDAVARGSAADAFDALIDLVYVALGTAYLHGFPFNSGWRRVQDANMEKVRGDAVTSKRGSTHDVVKPEGWQPPDLTDLVAAGRYEMTEADWREIEREFDDPPDGPNPPREEIGERDVEIDDFEVRPSEVDELPPTPPRQRGFYRFPENEDEEG